VIIIPKEQEEEAERYAHEEIENFCGVMLFDALDEVVNV
jgi:hypothetical protein